MIQGSHVNRVQPSDSENQEDDSPKKRQVLHQGRAWIEADENDLPLETNKHFTAMASVTEDSSLQVGVYADKKVLSEARALFETLTTVEAKAAQLCFYITDAKYDTKAQIQVELLIQNWDIGGILFQKGEYRRQAFLIERFQEISKIPLLIANDYHHGLSFYLQGSHFSKDHLTEKHFSDVGKAVMVQNRRLGVHIQFDRERGVAEGVISELQAKAFRKGVRNAHGIVGKEKWLTETDVQKGTFPFLSKEGKLVPSVLVELQVQETIGVKTLVFYDLSHHQKCTIESAFLKGFSGQYDLFLLGDELPFAIYKLTQLVRLGKISEENLDRHVMKVLILKALHHIRKKT